jgi:hypothetical protein
MLVVAKMTALAALPCSAASTWQASVPGLWHPHPNDWLNPGFGLQAGGMLHPH